MAVTLIPDRRRRRRATLAVEVAQLDMQLWQAAAWREHAAALRVIREGTPTRKDTRA